MRKIVALLLLAWMLPTSETTACSLCGSMSRNYSLAYEFEQASVVVYGQIANPMLGKAGGGTTEFHIERMLKDDCDFPRKKMMLLSRYLPILDPKTPPKYVMFFRSPKESLEPYWGKEIVKPAVLQFVAELQHYRKDPAATFLHAGKHLDHADPHVADEAFMVFAKADDKLIAQNVKRLDPAILRKLVKNPDLESERLSMLAYLLGACGNDDDAELLRTLLINTSRQTCKAYEGILAGYITMRPKEGWAHAHDNLKDPRRPFLVRYGTMRALRFFYNAKPDETGPQVMQGMSRAITHPDISDIAIQDLLKWKRWEHTKAIVACWNLSSHNSPIVKQGILRYALACPLPEARAFLERARRDDAELVMRMEEELK